LAMEAPARRSLAAWVPAFTASVSKSNGRITRVGGRSLMTWANTTSQPAA
jgi:hypothetical protein